MARTSAAEKVFGGVSVGSRSYPSYPAHHFITSEARWRNLPGLSGCLLLGFSFVGRLPRENGWVAPENGRQHRPGIFEAPFRESPKDRTIDHLFVSDKLSLVKLCEDTVSEGFLDCFEF